MQRKNAAPGSSRPDAGGSSGSSGGGPPKRRTRYTARAAVLLLVFCALVLALAYPLQQYVSQSSQLAKIRKQNAEKTAEAAQLEQQLASWQDSAFVEIQARRRLHYVMPGETGLRLLGLTDAAGAASGAATPGSAGTAWYSQLWDSVTAAASSPPSASPSGPAGPSASPPQAPGASPSPVTQPTPSPSGR